MPFGLTSVPRPSLGALNTVPVVAAGRWIAMDALAVPGRRLQRCSHNNHEFGSVVLIHDLLVSNVLLAIGYSGGVLCCQLALLFSHQCWLFMLLLFEQAALEWRCWS